MSHGKDWESETLWASHQQHWEQEVNGEMPSKYCWRNFPGGPVVNNLPCRADYAGSIHGLRTKIPYATWHGQNVKKIVQVFLIKKINSKNNCWQKWFLTQNSILSQAITKHDVGWRPLQKCNSYTNQSSMLLFSGISWRRFSSKARTRKTVLRKQKQPAWIVEGWWWWWGGSGREGMGWAKHSFFNR